MSLMSKLAARQLKLNRKRTFITLLGIILSVGMITAVAGFVFSMRDMMRGLYIDADGDWHAAVYNVTETQAAALAADEQVESSFTRADENSGALGLHFRLKNPTREYPATAKLLAARYGVEMPEFRDNKELLAVEGVIENDASLSMVINLAIIIVGIIVIGSVFVISNAFNISANERLNQFGLLKSAGATKKQIRACVLSEGLVLAGFGIPAGLIAGYGIEALALTIANSLLVDVEAINGAPLVFQPVLALLPLLIAAAISFATVMLSAWLPARRCARIPAIEAIRLSDEVKIRGKKLRVSRTLSRLFGFEAALALKALKRDRRKYRATVVSLVVSMVLFIAGASFGELLMKSTEMIYVEYGVNAVVGANSPDGAALDELDNRLEAIPGARLMSVRDVSYYLTAVPEGFISDMAQKYADSGFPASPEPGIRIAAVDEASFVQLCELAGVSREDMDSEETPSGILLNYALIAASGARIEFIPFNFTNGMTLDFRAEEENSGSIKLIGQAARELPVAAQAINSFNEANVVVSQKTYDQLSLSKDGQRASWLAQADDSEAFVNASREIYNTSGFEGSFSTHDIGSSVRTSRNIAALMTIFVYGFVVLLSLIGVTSVIGTISTGIRLRTREFAMLSSVGMTPEALRRMLNFESLFYGLRALCFGLPLGLIASALMQGALHETIIFAFLFPWQSMLISVFAVLLITFATMRYAAARIRDKSIVEALKDAAI